MPNLSEHVGPLPMWGWIVGGGAILGAFYLLSNAGGGGGSVQPTVIPVGSAAGGGLGGGGGLSAETLIAQARSEAAAQIAALKSDQAAQIAEMQAADTAEDSAFQQLIDGLKAQVKALSDKLGNSGAVPVPGDGGTSGGAGNPNNASWWKPAYAFQTRNILTGYTRDHASVWEAVPDWVKSNNRRGGYFDAATKLPTFSTLAAGLDTGFGFALPVAYDGRKDKGIYENGVTAWSMFWTRLDEYMRNHPNANPAEAADLQIRRIAGDALNMGYSLDDIGFTASAARAYTIDRLDLLRNDEALVARGLQIAAP